MLSSAIIFIIASKVIVVISIGFINETSQDVSDLKLAPRVLNGVGALLGEFPYEVSIRAYGSHQCGGVIIGPNHALSAGHCRKYVGVGTTIKAGGIRWDINEPSQQIVKVADVKQYKGFTQQRGKMLIAHADLVLITVTPAFVFNQFVNKVKLPSASYKPVPPGTKLLFAGWGRTGKRAPVSPSLGKIWMTAVTRDVCQIGFNKPPRVTIIDSMLCASGDQNKFQGTCDGDSGSPLTTNDRNPNRRTLLGIVSMGDEDCLPSVPTMFLYISHPAVRIWITQNSKI